MQREFEKMIEHTRQTVPDLKRIEVIFDAGPRTSGQLRYDTILVSHGHQDHLGGLPYLVSQRHMVKAGAPAVRIVFDVMEERAKALTIVDHDPVARARRLE